MRTHFHRILSVSYAIALAACSSEEGRCPTSSVANQDVYDRLSPSCIPCHGSGATRPFFASFEAFESSLVHDSQYVVPGDPDGSRLVQLLEGTATGAYAQMPIGGDSFAELSAAGDTSITVTEVRSWIAALRLDSTPAVPDSTAATTRRVSATEFVNAVEVALGYPVTGPSAPYYPAMGLVPRSPDSLEAPTLAVDTLREQTYLLLGGASYLQGRAAESSWSSSSLTAAMQLAQAACAQAVAARNPVLFHDVSPGLAYEGNESAYRANARYLFVRFLHAEPTEDDLDLYVGEILSAPHARADDAWTEMCTALMRDPLFLTF